VTPCSDVGG